MATKRSKAKGGQSRTIHGAGFSGEDRNMRAGGKVACRVINDRYPLYLKRPGYFRLEPVLHGLSYFDRGTVAQQRSVGTYDWASPA